ncbi:16395_t:CDS:2 [Gigaspora rosea]|nr:16395_t:CDS:2 [Gigaspora rosea]
MLYRIKLIYSETNLLVTAHKNQFNYTYPNDYKWKRINILIDLLHPVLEATKYFSKECIVADSINYKLDKYWSLLNEKITIDTILDLLSKLKTFLPEENKTTEQNKHRFPTLAIIACKYLVISGTSIPCEKTFSVAAGTITKVYSYLLSEIVQTDIRPEQFNSGNID